MEKRILTIQDFSCMGRCSLTVAIPTISACGVEAVSIPTAVLSNHTAFKSWTYLDLTDQMLPIVDKWQDYRHHFGMIYTGYLSNDQIPTVQEIFRKLKAEDTLIFVDPAMADNGHLYAGFDEKHVEGMKALMADADFIKPNLTEACLLTGLAYPGSEVGVCLNFYRRAMENLAALGPKNVILTGQNLTQDKVADLWYNRDSKALTIYETATHPGRYHGTGDLFASAFAGCIVRGLGIEQAIHIAHDYVHEAIGYTVRNKLDGITYGPDFESALPFLMKALEKTGK